MGNTVSAAEIAASQIIRAPIHDDTVALPKNHPKVNFDSIPAECPMHKQIKSECPINHGDVNPLNMVRVYIGV